VSVWAKALGVGVAWLCCAGPADADETVSGQLVVGFSAGTTAQRAEGLVARAGGAIKRRLGAINAAAVRPLRGRTLADLRAALRRLRAIRCVEPDFILRAGRSPDDRLYRYLDGTSMAAPFVTGAAAMLRAKDPSLTYAQLRSTLLASVDQLPSLQGRTATGGRLDVGCAMERTP
jgi:hypothetical protein